MTLRFNLRWRHGYLPALISLLAVSIYGLTIGRRIVQPGTWHFASAETLQFPYPLTVTLLQLLFSYLVLLGSGLLAVPRTVDFGDHSSLNQSSEPALDDICLDSTSSQLKVDSKYAAKGYSELAWAIGLESYGVSLANLLMAIIFTIETVLVTYVLYFAPLEGFLVSRSLVLLMPILFTIFPSKIFNITTRAVCPPGLLSVGVFFAAYQPNLPRQPRAEWVAISSSFLTAAWPLLLDRAVSSTKTHPQTRLARADSAKDQNFSDQLPGPEFWHLLRSIVLLSVFLLIPVLLFSGELGYIYRNCYSLGVPNFWFHLCLGAVFRLIFVVSSALFVEETSAFDYLFIAVSITISQILFLTYSKILFLQVVGLIICLATGVWFYHSNAHNLDLTDNLESAWFGQSNGSSRRWRPNATGTFFSGLTIIVAIPRFYYKANPVLEQNYIIPKLHTIGRPSIPMIQGADGYLGQRPHVNTVANFSVLVSECRGSYENLEYVRNVQRCLNFLATREDMYLSISEDIAGDRTPRSEEGTGIGIQTCEGPIIPYHLWWDGLPSWRTELCMKSYLYTQNLACSRLWIWIDVDTHPGAMDDWLDDPRFTRFLHLVHRGDVVLKKWKLPARIPLPKDRDELDKAHYYPNPRAPNADGDVAVADAVVRDGSGQEWLQLYNGETQLTFFKVAVSDAARLVILNLYGGVYLDVSIILLRDVRPLVLPGVGFAERWGTRTDPALYDNALLSLPANSSLSSYLLLGGARMGQVYNFRALGRMLHLEGRDDRTDRGLIKLETAFFDPAWAENDHLREGRCTVPCLPSFETVFQSAPILNEWESFDGVALPGSDSGNNRTLENFYRGAWAYNIHNQWELQSELGSWIDVICRAHDDFFSGSQANPYGESWSAPAISRYEI